MFKSVEKIAEEAYNYYFGKNGKEVDYKKAFNLYSKIAKKDNYANYILGMMYYFGQGVEKDYKKSFLFFSDAKEEYNNVRCFLGRMCRDGLGRDKNLEAANLYFSIGAEKGDNNAQYEYALFRAEDNHYPSDLMITVDYMNKAAIQGHKQAKQWLDDNSTVVFEQIGNMLQRALNHFRATPPDESLAKYWAEIAGEVDNGAPMKKYCKLYQELGNEYNKTDDDVQALIWYKKAAELGDEYSMYCIGHRYRYGQGVDKNEDTAMEWLNKAAKKGSTNAKDAIKEWKAEKKTAEKAAKEAEQADEEARTAICPWCDVEVLCKLPPKKNEIIKHSRCGKSFRYIDRNKSLKYDAEKEVQERNRKGEEALSEALDYLNGTNGKPKDFSSAIDWFLQGAGYGNTECMVRLGNLYYQAQDYDEAEIWLTKSANLGSIESMYALGVLLSASENSNPKYTLAVEWLRKAVAAGHQNALKYLNLLGYKQ